MIPEDTLELLLISVMRHRKTVHKYQHLSTKIEDTGKVLKNRDSSKVVETIKLKTE